MQLQRLFMLEWIFTCGSIHVSLYSIYAGVIELFVMFCMHLVYLYIIIYYMYIVI